MNPFTALFFSSLGKKYIMAVTGLALVGFVAIHMVGNLQVFGPPDWINAYAHKLKTLPAPVLWGFRLGLLVVTALHVWMAIMLTMENRRAAAKERGESKPVQASISSRTMRTTGIILLSFIIIHIIHFTIRWWFGFDSLPYTTVHGDPVYDVHTMMLEGFSKWYMSLFYVIAMALLCFHLAHGVASMFQSLGLRNQVWRKRLELAGLAYGWAIFIGFAAMPIAIFSATNGGPKFGIETERWTMMTELREDPREAIVAGSNEFPAELAANR